MVPHRPVGQCLRFLQQRQTRSKIALARFAQDRDRLQEREQQRFDRAARSDGPNQNRHVSTLFLKVLSLDYGVGEGHVICLRLSMPVRN
jgi:hypothetical protein